MNTTNLRGPTPICSQKVAATFWQRLCFLPLLLLSAPLVFATANYVYHERTANNPGCGTVAYVPILNPTSAQAYDLRFKVEYVGYTDSLRVYYTTDGSTPSGAKGVASGTTQTAVGSYLCTFGSDPTRVDVC